MADEITLTIPSEDGFEHVAHLVVGGLGTRLDLTLEHLEDIQLAIDSLLERGDGGPLTVAIRVDERMMHAAVGPFAADGLDELESDGTALGLRRILETVCDSFEVEERNGHRWVRLTKRTETAA